jgi:acetolactate synthase small subunit
LSKVECKYCHEEFNVPPSRVWRSNYCSFSCRERANLIIKTVKKGDLKMRPYVQLLSKMKEHFTKEQDAEMVAMIMAAEYQNQTLTKICVSKMYQQLPAVASEAVTTADEIAEKVTVERLLREHGARAVVIRKDYTIFETSGHREETDKLVNVLAPYGLIEFVRSARVAIIKASHGFHEKLREFEEAMPGEEQIENEFLDKQESVFTM